MTSSLKQGYCPQLSRWAPNAIICIFIRGKQREISYTHTHSHTHIHSHSHTHTWRGEGKVTMVAKTGVMWPQVKGCLKLAAGRGREWVLPWRIHDPAHTLILAQWNWFQTSAFGIVKEWMCVVLSYQLLVICYNTHRKLPQSVIAIPEMSNQEGSTQIAGAGEGPHSQGWGSWNQLCGRKTGFRIKELELHLWFATYQPRDTWQPLASVANLWKKK